MTEKELAERLIEALENSDITGTELSLADVRQAAAALEGRNKRAELVKAGWIRAAEEAFAGDMGALRNRVVLAKEGMPQFEEQPTAPAESGPSEERLREILAEEFDRSSFGAFTASCLREEGFPINPDTPVGVALAAMRRLATADGREVRSEDQFDYFECPDCGFSSIQRAAFDGTDICPLCAGDNGRDVVMRRRTCRPDDKAEGFDARKSRATERGGEKEST